MLVIEDVENQRQEELPYFREAWAPAEYHRRALEIPAQPTPCIRCGWPLHSHRRRRAFPSDEK